MEDQKPLQAWAIVRQLADTVQDIVDDFFANGVVTTGVVIGCIFFASNHLFWMKQLLVLTATNFIDHT